MQSKESSKTYFSKEYRIILAIFSLALVLRLLHIYSIITIPFFNHPIVDEKEHYDWALKILGGDIFSAHKMVFFKSPGYPYFLALLLLCTAKNIFWVKVLQAVMGAVSSVLVYLIAREKFGKGVGIFSGFIMSIYPLFIYYDAMLLITSFFILMILLVLYVSLRLEKKQTIILTLLTGLLVGIGCITRPNLILFIPFHIIWMLMVFDLGKRWKYAIVRILIYLLPVVLVICSVTLRNYLVDREFFLIATNGDLNFYLANNPDSSYTLNLRPGLEWEIFLQTPYKELGENISKKKVQLFWRQKSLDYIKKNPLQFAFGKIINLYRFFDGYEYRRIQMYDYYKKHSPILRIPVSFYIISPLAIIGIILAFKEFRKNSLFIFFIISFILSIILFFVASRHRLPIVPVLIIFASCTIMKVVDAVRKRNYKFVVLVGIIFVLYLIVYLPFKPDEKQMESWWTHYSLGLVYFDEENLINATSELTKAETIRSENIDTHYALGNVYKKRLMLIDAIKEFKFVLGKLEEKFGDFNVILARLNKEIGGCYLRLKNTENAEKYYNEALNYDNTDPGTYNALGIIEIYKGDIDKAKSLFRYALELDPNFEEAQKNLERL